MCLKSDDELFHVHLYDWLISHKLTEKLLEVSAENINGLVQGTGNSSALPMEWLQSCTKQSVYVIERTIDLNGYENESLMS